ncbi:MAG: Transcriptional activator protein CzcR [Anaerolineae bacterium]|nr:Transcriptional activator protein CzcR [Anaerolineae bacterium]
MSRTKILYVEGHAILRDVYAQLLGLSADFELDVATNGLEGVHKAEIWQPDLILMGLRMPIMDGFEAIRLIRSQSTTAAIPIIVLSAWNSANHKQRVFEAGANAHLTPPIEIAELVKKIHALLPH